MISMIVINCQLTVTFINVIGIVIAFRQIRRQQTYQTAKVAMEGTQLRRRQEEDQNQDQTRTHLISISL